MTPERLAEIKAELDRRQRYGLTLAGEGGTAAELLAEVERLRGLLRRWREAHYATADDLSCNCTAFDSVWPETDAALGDTVEAPNA